MQHFLCLVGRSGEVLDCLISSVRILVPHTHVLLLYGARLVKQILGIEGVTEDVLEPTGIDGTVFCTEGIFAGVAAETVPLVEVLLVVSLKAKCQFYRNSRLALDIRSIVGHCHKGQILAHIDIIQRGRVCTGDTVFLIGINDERSARVRRSIVAAGEIDEPNIFALAVIGIVGFYGVVSRLHFPRVSLNRVGRYIGDLNGEGTAGYLCGSGEVLIVRSLGERLQRPAPVTIRGHVSCLGGSAGNG